MKFKIRNKEYDAVEGLKGASLQTLYVLKVKYGISLKTMADAARKLEGIEDSMQILDDVENFQTFMVIIWLARKHAGEKLTLEEANDDFGLADLVLVTPDDEPVPDPKAQADSVPAVSVPAAPLHHPTLTT